ncbi:hypothetical protein [Treponema saccharophilum]|uniref:hypothetical protein n=1 Tax=Treponema saccharophilum TaxID=165 RepID=UPI00386EF4AA
MKKIFSRLIIAASAGLLALSGCKVFDSLESQDDEPISYAQISSDTLSGAYGLSARADYTVSLGNTKFSSKLIESSADATANLSEYFSVALLSDSGEDVTDSLVDTANTNITALKAISSSSANIRVKLAVKESSATGDISGTVQITAAKAATSSGEEVKCIMNSDAKFTLGHAGAVISDVIFSGKPSAKINTQIEVSLKGFSFKEARAGDEIASINNSSDKLTALYDIEAESPSAVLIFSGTPAAASTDAITLSIDSNKLMDSNGETIDAVITSDENANARWNIASDAGYISNIEGAWAASTKDGKIKGLDGKAPRHSLGAAANGLAGDKNYPGNVYYIDVTLEGATTTAAFESIGTAQEIDWIKNIPSSFSATLAGSNVNGNRDSGTTLADAKAFTIALTRTKDSGGEIISPKFINIVIPAEMTTANKALHATSPKLWLGVSPALTLKGANKETLTSTSGTKEYTVTIEGDTFKACTDKEVYIATTDSSSWNKIRSEADKTLYPRPYAVFSAAEGATTGTLKVYPNYLATTDALTGDESNFADSYKTGDYLCAVYLPEGSTNKYPLSTPNNSKAGNYYFKWTASSGMATYAPTETQIASDGITVSASATECLAGSSVTLTAAPTSKYIDKTLLTYQWEINTGSEYASLTDATYETCILSVKSDAPTNKTITVKCTATYNYGGTESTATASANVTTKVLDAGTVVNATWTLFDGSAAAKYYASADYSGSAVDFGDATSTHLTTENMYVKPTTTNASANAKLAGNFVGRIKVSNKVAGVGHKNVSGSGYASATSNYSAIGYFTLSVDGDCEVSVTGYINGSPNSSKFVTVRETTAIDTDIAHINGADTSAVANTATTITFNATAGKNYNIYVNGCYLTEIKATTN